MELVHYFIISVAVAVVAKWITYHLFEKQKDSTGHGGGAPQTGDESPQASKDPVIGFIRVFWLVLIGAFIWIATTNRSISSFNFHRAIAERPMYQGPQSTFIFHDNPHRLEILLDSGAKIIRPFRWESDRGLCFYAFDKSYCDIPERSGVLTGQPF